MREAGVGALAIAIDRAGAMVETGYHGMSAAGQPVTATTRFAAASLSKPVFALIVLKLVERGLLGLDDPLSRWVPDYVADDPRAASVTVSHVLSHSCGLPNWRSEALALRTHFAPGIRFSYAGDGFVWLQQVVEAITAGSLESLARALVFGPLGMSRSSFVAAADDDDFAVPRDEHGNQLDKRWPDANAAYSLHSTATDYARFLAGALQGRLLSPSLSSQWLRPLVSVPTSFAEASDPRGTMACDEAVAWALGWGVETVRGAIFHRGSNPGYRAFVLGMPGEGDGVVLFAASNRGLALAPALVGRCLPGRSAALAWLGHPSP